MLEMGRQAAVLGHCCPPVLFDFNFVASGIDHRLDGQDHALPQSNSTVRFAVIRHRRFLMQLLADAMTHEGTDNRVASTLCGLLNRKAEIAQPLSRVELFDSLV